jgi:flagellar protein FlaI
LNSVEKVVLNKKSSLWNSRKKEGGNVIKTKIDDLVEMSKKERLPLNRGARTIGWDVNKVEEIAKFLDSKGVVKLTYPVNFFSEPYITTKVESKKDELELEPVGKELDSYELNVDNVPATITIFAPKDEGRPVYAVELPEIGPYTKLYLEFFRDLIAERVPVQTEDISDIKRVVKLKKKFYVEAQKIIKEYLGEMDKKTYDILAGVLLHEMYGLGDLEILMGDDWLEELAVNNAEDPVAIYHRVHGWMKTNMYMPNEERVLTLASQISRKAGREINLMNPIVDAHLVTGDRVASTIFPISSKGNTITIRKFSRSPWTIIHLIDPKHQTTSKSIAAFLWLAMQYELNMLVSGGTASGKTSMLNAIAAFFPPQHRIITIEDTREISLPEHLDWNWVPMVTRGANPEGKGEISMLDLMIASLRMRPDRIIVGEVRRRKEAEALFEAMHTGHSVYSTIHADTAAQVVRRLIEPPIEIPEMELEALHLIVMQYRDRIINKRKTLEVAEIVPTGAEGGKMKPSYVFRWRARANEFSKVSEPMRVMETLNLHTGMTVREIKEDLARKESILQWMLDNKLSSITDVGRVMKEYYKDPSNIEKAAETNMKPGKVIP